MKTLLLTVFLTVTNSILVAGILTFFSVIYLDNVNIFYIVIGFFFFASLMAVVQIVGVFGQHPRKNDHVYGLEFVVIFLASASILGVLGLQDEIIQKRHEFSVSKAKYFYSYARRYLDSALKNVCSQGSGSKEYCIALENIGRKLSKGFDVAEVSATDGQYLIVMKDNCCPDQKDVPIDVIAAKFFLDQYVSWKVLMEVTRTPLSKVHDEYSMFNSWVDISVFKIFLLFLGAIAGAIKVGLTASKYVENYGK